MIDFISIIGLIGITGVVGYDIFTKKRIMSLISGMILIAYTFMI